MRRQLAWSLYSATARWIAPRRPSGVSASKAKPVAVPYVVGLQQAQAVNLITNKNLVPRVRRVYNSDVDEGFVFAQNPTEGTRVDKQSQVIIDVSKGKPQVTIPDVVGDNVTDAVNYGDFISTLTSIRFGQPTTAGPKRRTQLGFRMDF